MTCAPPGPARPPPRSPRRLRRAGPFWLHFDVDVLDSGAFPATDYLIPTASSWEELRATIAPLLASPALVGASLGCYNPEKDPGLACGRATGQRSSARALA